ncbi:hypothetical protein Efla_002121 [Eimeria flavescens]
MQSSLVKYTSSRIVRQTARSGRSSSELDFQSSGLGSSKQRGSKPLSTTEDIINSILPPREWTEGGEVWSQSVSTTPATRADVVALQEELDKRLRLRRAKAYGICPIREELYSQCFDELLRQVTIQCAERGLLLNRVRRELRSLMNAHRRLYESSAAFGVRKALLAQADREAREEVCTQMQQANTHLEQAIEYAQTELAEVVKEHEQKLAAENADHEASVAALRRKAQKVKREIERLLSTIQQV